MCVCAEYIINIVIYGQKSMRSSSTGMSSSTRVVRMAAVVGSGEEPEFTPSDVAASYRLRTSREHNDAEMLVEKPLR